MSVVKSTFTLNDGTEVPWLAFGTGTALFGRDASEFIRVAIGAGIVHLDGAQFYANEESVGEGIKASGKPRSELFITTKLLPKPKPGDTVKGLLTESLRQLGVDYVDLFLIHSPEPIHSEGKLASVWKEVEAIQKEGLAKSIGVSNFRVKDLKVVLETGTVKPSVNQIELHPYVYEAAKPIIELSQEHGITIASYGGLSPIVRAAGGPVDPVVEGIAARLTKEFGKPVSSGQVLTKWILQKGAFVVTTSSKVARIKEFQESFDVPDLTANDLNAIDEAGSKLYKRFYMKHLFE